MALTLVEQVRLNVGDTDISLPILSDSEYEYFLESANNSVGAASIQAAKTILFKLSINSQDEQISILSIKGSKASAAYMEALKLFIRDPSLNPLYNNASAWAGGISKADINTNNSTLYNNIPQLATNPLSCQYTYDADDSNPFLIWGYYEQVYCIS